MKRAFENAEYTDHKEHLLVDKLRKSNIFIPELSLVAELDKKIIGHIMFTKLIIENQEKKYDSLALVPVSVLPEYQNQGIGSELIKKGLKLAKELGFKSVIVLGHDKYYPRFGFEPTSKWNIKAPFDVPEEAFMALELEDNSLKETNGIVIYSKEFLE